MNFIWNLVQQRTIEKQRREIRDAADRARAFERESRSSISGLDQLALAVDAIWALLKEKHGLEDHDLVQKMKEIDASDGAIDGRGAATVKSCIGCGRPISTKIKTCVHCGTENINFSPFKR